MAQRITWNLVRNTLIRELQGAAERAGLDTADWRLDDGPWPDLVAGGKRWNDGWALASECARYLRGWTDALSCVAAAREAAAEDQHPVSPRELEWPTRNEVETVATSNVNPPEHLRDRRPAPTSPNSTRRPAVAEIDTDLLDAVLVDQLGKHAAQEVWSAYDHAVRDAGRPPVVVVDVPGLAPSAVRHFLLTPPGPVHMAMWREVGMFVSWLECRVAGERETWEASTTHEHTPALLVATEQYDVSVEEVPRG